jgi:hypothetical protein
MNHLSVQTKLEIVPLNLIIAFKNKVQFLSLLLMNKYIGFLNKSSTVILPRSMCNYRRCFDW